MQHPESLIIPLLMLVDYFLTLVGARLAEEKYLLHFRIATYELNPIWQKSVQERRWFNPRHLVLVALVTILLLLGDSQADVLGQFFSFLVGILLGAFGSVVGLHI